MAYIVGCFGAFFIYMIIFEQGWLNYYESKNFARTMTDLVQPESEEWYYDMDQRSRREYRRERGGRGLNEFTPEQMYDYSFEYGPYGERTYLQPEVKDFYMSFAF